MKALSGFLQKISTGWIALVGLAVFILFTIFVLPMQSANADASDENVGSPDLSFYYSVDDLYAMADAYGEVGRSEYIRARFTFDILWPLVYGVFLATSISWLFGRGFEKASPLQFANLAPVFGVLFDCFENLTTSLVMYRYPAKTVVIDFFAPFFTLTKWIFVGGSFLILLVGVAVWIIALIRKSKG